LIATKQNFIAIAIDPAPNSERRETPAIACTLGRDNADKDAAPVP
jgi:hypothetical protein